MKRGEPRKRKMNHSAGFRSEHRVGILRDGQGGREKEPQRQRQDAEIDVPDQPGTDQHELVAEREVGSRQQPFAYSDRAKAVGVERLEAAHAAPSAACATLVPPIVACPWLRRRVRRPRTISLSRVRVR